MEPNYRWMQAWQPLDNERIITHADWHHLTHDMHEKGYAIIEQFLTVDQCHELVHGYDRHHAYRKTVSMEKHRFGVGEYKYFNYPLPDLIQEVRTNIYSQLAPIANAWFDALNLGKQFPLSHTELLRECYENGQREATVLILKYGKGGYNTLHQDLYGDIFFPIQAVVFLSEPNQDFTGGEFVLTQQIPRAQSKAIVLSPRKGDMLIFTTNFKPQKGSRGYYRVNVKHGVSEVRSGNRYSLGIIFHDALR